MNRARLVRTRTGGTIWQRYRPIYISNTADVPEHLMQGVVDATMHILRMAEVQIRVKHFGTFEVHNEDFGSAQWYVNRTWDRVRRQVNGEELLNLMAEEPYQETEPHYDIFVTGRDLWAGEDKNNFVFGLTKVGQGTVQSTARLSLGTEDIKTITYHEVAHIFGAPSHRRKNISSAYGGAHCIDRSCSMQQSNIEGHATIQTVTSRRIKRGTPYCSDCLSDIRAYFGRR